MKLARDRRLLAALTAFVLLASAWRIDGAIAAEPAPYGPIAEAAANKPTDVSSAETPASSGAPSSESPPAPASPAPSTTNAPSSVAPPQERQPLGTAKILTPSPITADHPGGAAPGQARAIMDSAAVRTIGALALVIALMVGLRWIVRRVAGGAGGLASQLGAAGRAPSGLLEVLGRYPIARGQTLVLLRLDRRLVLLSQTTGGFSTLSEITDPDEVASILVKARDDDGASNAARFNALLRQVERDPSVASFAPGESDPVSPRRAPALPRAGMPLPGEHEDRRPLTGAESLRERLGHLRDMVA